MLMTLSAFYTVCHGVPLQAIVYSGQWRTAGKLLMIMSPATDPRLQKIKNVIERVNIRENIFVNTIATKHNPVNVMFIVPNVFNLDQNTFLNVKMYLFPLLKYKMRLQNVKLYVCFSRHSYCISLIYFSPCAHRKF